MAGEAANYVASFRQMAPIELPSHLKSDAGIGALVGASQLNSQGMWNLAQSAIGEIGANARNNALLSYYSNRDSKDRRAQRINTVLYGLAQRPAGSALGVSPGQLGAVSPADVLAGVNQYMRLQGENAGLTGLVPRDPTARPYALVAAS